MKTIIKEKFDNMNFISDSDRQHELNHTIKSVINDLMLLLASVNIDNNFFYITNNLYITLSRTKTVIEAEVTK